MQSIALSPAIAAADPALVHALRAAGIHPVEPGAERRRGERRVVQAGEAAAPNDVIVDLAAAAPAFARAADGRAARIAYPMTDAGFGHALVAELLRPERRPAAADADSQRLMTLAGRVAQSDATVLVLGATGTGKEGMARHVHACSPRAAGPFVAVNCAALPETMLEAMLFGHQKGSFTGAGAAGEGLFRAAEGGTLLLDEIAEMPLALQAKLLRAIQEREVLPVGATRAIAVDVRIVAAANRDLAAEVEAGRFRADLYWRLNVLPLTLRPLAERPADLPAILAALLVRHAPADQPFPWPTATALAKLAAHRWPGNVRELENVVQRALLLRAGERLDADDLSIVAPPPPRHCEERSDDAIQAGAGWEEEPGLLRSARNDDRGMGKVVRLADAARSTETKAIAEALAATGGNRVRAAGLLGISERTLRYRLAGIRAATGELAAA